MSGVPAASLVAPTAPSVAPATPVPTPSASASASAAPVATSPAPAQRVAASTSAAVPAFGRIYVIVMENREYGSIVGSANAPYLNGLIRRYGLATRYYGVTHPSFPNYLALFSGSTQGVRDDAVHNFASKNLADQIQAHGKTWRVFAENVPLGCYKRAVASGGEDGTGTYARKHEPAISFTNISGSARRCSFITDFRHFSPTAANFELIVPNMCHDMHDCSVRTGDNFLSRFVPKITGSSAFANSVLFITWDEGSTTTGGGGHIATLVISPRVRAGTRSATVHNHYSLLRTIENAWGLGCLGKSCTANDLREFFQ
jgi:phosphatidylinositol-3-phosphatase